MPIEASDIARLVCKPPFLHKQNPEPAVIYNRCIYVSNTKLVCFYIHLNGLTGNSLSMRELEESKRDSTAPAQLIAQLPLRKGNVNVKVSKDLTNTASSSDSLRTGLATGEQHKALRFNNALSQIIPPAGRAGYK